MNNYFLQCTADLGGGKCKEDPQDPFLGRLQKL